MSRVKWTKGRASGTKNIITGFLVLGVMLFANLSPVFTFAEGEETPQPAPVQEAAPVQQVVDPTPVAPVPVEGNEPVEQPAPSAPVDPSTPSEDANTSTPTTSDTDGAPTDPVSVDTNISSGSTSTDPLPSGNNESTPTTATSTGGGLLEQILAPLIGGGDDATSTATSTLDLGTTTATSTGTSTSLLDLLNLGTTTASSSVASSTLHDPNATNTPEGNSIIDTGDAISTANILNIENTNSVNSTGTIIMANLNEGHTGTLDLRDAVGSGAISGGGGVCTVTSCGGVNSVTANINSGASIDNELVLQAQTGSNTAANAANAIIETGDAFAGLNLVNLANTNFIDSNYFVLSLNSFKDINGNIILPSLSKFLPALLNAYNNLNVNTNNLANVQNNVDMDANSGANGSSNTINSLTNTGDAQTSANVYNNVNNTTVGGKSIAILLRITGKWLGQFLGLPDGAQVAHEGDTYLLKINEDGTAGELIPVGDLTVNSTSTADIKNNVRMLADTGNNNTDNTVNSIIDTGNAFTGANIVNLANTNIIGSNWMLAIINIFGDLNGNIMFGMPDLVVSQDVVGSPANGGSVTFNVTVTNTGDREANNVVLKCLPDGTYLTPSNFSIPFTDAASGYAIPIGTIEPGQTKTLSYNALIHDAAPGTQIANTVRADIDDDNNALDNASTRTLAIGGGGGYSPVIYPYNIETTTSTTTPVIPYEITANMFTVVRSTGSSQIIGLTNSTHQTVTLKNITNKLVPNVTFYDVITDQDGNIIRKQNWPLGDVNPNEEIVLDYDISFANTAHPGIYNLGSEVYYGTNQKMVFGNNGVIALVVPEVLGASTTIAANVIPKKNNFTMLGSVAEASDGSQQGPQQPVQTYTPVEGGGGGSGPGFNIFDTKNMYYALLLIISSVFGSVYTFLKRPNVM